LRNILSSLLFLTLALAPLRGANLDRPAKELKFTLGPGREALLGQYKGKVVVLEFLLTTCSHCQVCSRTMEKLSKEFAGKGVQMIGIAINEGADKLVPAYIQQLGLQYPVGWNTNSQVPIDFLQHPIMTRMMMPQLVFIDRAGIIRAQYPGSDAFFQNEEKNMREMIQKLLKPAAPSKPAAKKAS
jgi:peroxiredoxin